MSFLPSKDAAPPAVEHLRQRLRDSRLGRLVARRPSLTAVVVALVAVAKTGRLGLIQLAWLTRHPDQAVSWFGDHWVGVAISGAVVFAVAFVAARMGIRWVTHDSEARPSRLEAGPGWAHRPPDAGTLHVPRGG